MFIILFKIADFAGYFFVFFPGYRATEKGRSPMDENLKVEKSTNSIRSFFSSLVFTVYLTAVEA
jgi:hypothetical protein